MYTDLSKTTNKVRDGKLHTVSTTNMTITFPRILSADRLN